MDGDDALRLKVTLNDGDIVYYYLDPDTYLEIRKEVQSLSGNRCGTAWLTWDLTSRWKESCILNSISEGSRNNPSAQVTTLDKIGVNQAFQPSDFALPASLKPAQSSDNKKIRQ